MSTQYLTPPSNSRPLPKRLLSLQHPPSARPTPPNYNYPSPTSPDCLVVPTAPPRPLTTPSRPGAPRRSVSFCGDPSASTYALASAGSCTHLSPDKQSLVAPPLERTLSSIGVKGNCSPPTQQMNRPYMHRTVSATTRPLQIPPTPPSSPPAVPQITLQTPSPSRPGLNPVQRSGMNLGSLARRTSNRQVPYAPSHSYTSSRSSSFTITTPHAEVSPPVPTLSTSHRKGWLKTRNDLHELDNDDANVENDVEMMEVDGMIERVEDLVMA